MFERRQNYVYLCKNICIADELTVSNSDDDDPTVKNALFGTVTLAKNVDTDKYENSGYGIGFDRIGSFLYSGIGFGRNVTVFGVDMNSSVHVDKKKGHTLTIHWPQKKCIQLILLWLKINFV